MRRRFPQPLGLVIAQQKITKARGTTLPIPEEDWESSVGTKIAEKAQPSSLRDNVLWVRVVSSGWAQELSLLSETILDSLRARGHQLTELRFHVGKPERTGRAPDREHQRQAPPRAPLPVPVLKALAQVEDSDLRKTLVHAAELNLGWQQLEESRKPKKSNRR